MKNLPKWEKVAILLVALTIAFEVARSPFAQRWIGDRFPVVGFLSIENMRVELVDGQVGARISGSANKLRDCTFQSMHWFLGGPWGVPITARFTDPPRKNQPGVLHWSGLLVGISPDRIEETYGEVTHRCGLFLVRSAFYVRGLRETDVGTE